MVLIIACSDIYLFFESVSVKGYIFNTLTPCANFNALNV